MPWIEFLSGRKCILLWILYGDMVDFSFIVSLYVSDLPNVTISTVPYPHPSGLQYSTVPYQAAFLDLAALRYSTYARPGPADLACWLDLGDQGWTGGMYHPCPYSLLVLVRVRYKV